MLKNIGRLVVVLNLPFLAYGFGVAAYTAVTPFDHLSLRSPRFLAFAVGFAGFALLWVCFKRHLEVFCTFEHELTHLLVGLLFLRIPYSFVVTRDRGYVEHSGRSNFLITLSPYFLPTITYLLIPLAWIIPAKFVLTYAAVLAATVAYHLLSTKRELFTTQPDLQRAGLLFSSAFLPVANFAFFGGAIAMGIAGTASFVGFWVQGATESWNLYRTVYFSLAASIPSS
ncbi:MAG: hypothetical protein IPI64_00065 [Chloracidobacterium sp.]|nr:hypothetical protein [Chloracidobacterium sp.]